MSLVTCVLKPPYTSTQYASFSANFSWILQIFLTVNLKATDVQTTSVSLIVSGVMGKLIVMGAATSSIAVRGVFVRKPSEQK